jgi:Protein of unknown function (DUF2628)
MYCTSCGMYLTAHEKVCSNCGKSIYERPKQRFVPPADIEYEKGFLLKSQREECFIGENYEYYHSQWNHLENRESKLSWNWAAFLLGPVWFGFRKMPAPVLAIIGMLVGLDILAYLSDYQQPYGRVFTVLILTLVLSLWILMGLLGNYIYFKYAETRFSQMNQSSMTPMEKKEWLKAKGNTSWAGAFLSLVLYLLFLSFTIYISI